MKLILQPTGAFATIRAARLRVWRGAARRAGPAYSCFGSIVAYSTLGPSWRAGASLERLELAPTADMSAYRGVGARLWRDGGRVLAIALVHLDDWAPVELAAALAGLSPESLGSLRLAIAS
jgi:hypothetical protein